MYYNVSEVPGILPLFISTFCDHKVFYNLRGHVKIRPASGCHDAAAFCSHLK